MVLISVGFGLAGMLTGGMMQADVTVYEQVFGLNHEQVSFWLSAFSVLSAFGGMLAGWMADRHSAAGPTYRMSLVFSCIGLVLFAVPQFGIAGIIAGYAVAGLAVGGLVVGNILVSRNGDGTPCRSINLLHTSHGIARLAGVLLSVAAVGMSWRLSYIVLAAAFLLLAALYASSPSPRTSAETRGDIHAGIPLNPAPLSMVGAGFFAYMIAEMVLVTWLPAYFEKERMWSVAASKLAYAVFLGGLIIGRLACAKMWPVEMPRAVRLYLGIVHAVAIAVFLFADSPLFLCGSLLAAGICQGPGWPAIFAYAIRRSPGSEGKLTGFIYLVCCTAIVVSTAGSGIVAQHEGIEVVFYVVGAAHVAFTFLFWKMKD